MDCACCGRRDLPASEFSKLTLEIRRINPASILHCAKCVAESRSGGAQVKATTEPKKPPPQPRAQPPAAPKVLATTTKASKAPTWAAAAPPSIAAAAADAFELGSAILETSTIAPSEGGDASDDDLDEDLAEAGFDEEVDVEEDEPDATGAKAGATLSTAALADHERRTEVIERRQFNCPVHGTFWKKAIARKPLGRCLECGENGPKYEAIPKEEERGRGFFVCEDCGNTWTSNSACRGLAQYCQGKGCDALDRQKGTFPSQMRQQLPRWKLNARRGGTTDGAPLPGISEDDEAAAAAPPAGGKNGGGAPPSAAAPDASVAKTFVAAPPAPPRTFSYAQAAAGESGGAGLGGGATMINGRDADAAGTGVGGAAAKDAAAVLYGAGGHGAGGAGGGGVQALPPSGAASGNGVVIPEPPPDEAPEPAVNGDGAPRPSLPTAAMAGFGGGGGGRSGGGGGGGGGGGERSGRECFNCGKEGHQARDCPEPRKGSQGSRNGRPGGGGKAAGLRDHFCSGCATGACRRPPPVSKIHIPTGSTNPGSLSAKTWSTNGSVAFTEGSINSFFSAKGVARQPVAQH